MSMRDFRAFKLPIQLQFQRLSTHHDLFRVEINKDELWALYLSAFPMGTNQIFRKRTEHDCSCCRQFVRAVGDVVAIIDNKIISIWDIDCVDETYQEVADTLARYVRSRSIHNLFLHTEHVAGTDKTFEQITETGTTPVAAITWNHFFVNIPSESVAKKDDIGPKLSNLRALHDVMLRSLTELRDDAIETVLDLISQGSLYRGEEHRGVVEAFRDLKKDFVLVAPEARDLFVWSRVTGTNHSVGMIRNTAIGTLLIDLSEGMNLDTAVTRFEKVMAPTNYKRPTALVTQKMIDSAKQKLTELGLISALERRYARLTDISVNDLLFVDRSSRRALLNDVFDELPTRAHPASQQTTKIDEVSMEAFIHEVLPRVTSLEVLVENRLLPNLVSLVAPVDATAQHLFKWPNAFSWSYRGDFDDSIKERVKAAGGQVTGDLCCRLAWNNYDDLDLHMVEPTGYEVYFRNKGITSSCGGKLDVDMNAFDPLTRQPVENIFYTQRRLMREGTYRLLVHNFRQRESKDVGFEVEIDYMGSKTNYVYDKIVKNDMSIEVVKFTYHHDRGVEVIQSMPVSQRQQIMWGVKTQSFQRVNVMMLSPNFWDGRIVGNKHYFFMLDECKNDGTARGFFNEFMKEELTPHRKVIEMVGARMRTEEDEEQLSGLGFSSTQRNSVTVRVKGAYTRTLKIVV